MRSADPRLDYVPRLVDTNRPYRVDPAPPDLLTRAKYWTPGTEVLDQGREGACVGFGCTGECMASPARGKFYGFTGNQIASGVYRRAKQIDEWEGVDYEGTSVRAGMLVGRELGWWDGFHWAFNMYELRTALESGPVVIGVDWREGAYVADHGVLDPTGDSVGGHCLLVTGYTPRHRLVGGPAYRLRNSWGRDWGANGSAYIAVNNLDRILFESGGEAAVPTGRHL